MRVGSLHFSAEFHGVSTPHPCYRIGVDPPWIVPTPCGGHISSAAAENIYTPGNRKARIADADNDWNVTAGREHRVELCLQFISGIRIAQRIVAIRCRADHPESEFL